MPQVSYHIMPVGSFVPHHPVTYFYYDGRGSNNFAKLHVQKKSGTDHVTFDVRVFEGVVNVNPSELQKQLPPNKTAGLYFSPTSHEATRSGDAQLPLWNEMIAVTPGLTYTVALVATLNPGIATDDMVYVDSTDLHIVSQSQPKK